MGKILTRPPYGNCKVLNEDGNLMFRCDERKINWYLKRNLATVVSANPCVIQLKFEPKGPGHVGDAFYLQDKACKCVVCGATNYLTKHHIVPKGYRKFFPEELKTHSSYDVLVMCIQCHETYEEFAFALKKIIAQEHNIPVHGKGKRIDERISRVRWAATALVNHRHKMPPKRIEELMDRLREYYGKQDITEEELQAANELSYLSSNDYVHHGKQVIDETPDIEAFVKRWRKHFFDTMQPQFLPDYWNVDRPLKRVENVRKKS